jgi:hypothetical protein
MTYDEYLPSPQWRQLRSQAIARDGRKCRLCNSSHRLQAHHRHYPPYGAWHLDRIENLTTLCVWCHERVDHRRQRQLQLRARRELPQAALLVTVVPAVALLIALMDWHPLIQSLIARCH